jgi:hypothetical protein
MKKLIHMGWLLRYWALGKYRRLVFIIALLALAWMAVKAAVGVATTGTRLAYIIDWYYIVYQIIIMIVVAAISYATRPTPEKPEARTTNAPQVKDGASVVRVYGDVWIDDPVVLAWQQAGTKAIKTKGGKK